MTTPTDSQSGKLKKSGGGVRAILTHPLFEPLAVILGAAGAFAGSVVVFNANTNSIAKEAREAVTEAMDGKLSQLDDVQKGFTETDAQMRGAIGQLAELSEQMGELRKRLDPRSSDGAPRKDAIFIVLPMGGSSASATDMREGIVQGWPTADPARPDEQRIVPLAKGRKLHVVWIDDGPTGDATARRFAQQQKLFRPVLVIGHDTSTQALEMSRLVYQPEELPTILLGPTNPRITTDAVLAGRHIFLRLLPNDYKQASKIRDLVAHKDYKTVILVVDQDNREYAKFLADQLMSPDLSDARTAIPEFSRRIVLSLEVSATSTGNIDFVSLQRLRPDAIVVLGMTEASLGFMRVWRSVLAADSRGTGSATVEEALPRPSLVFSDGCATSRFHEAVADLLQSSDTWGECFLMSPMRRTSTEKHKSAVVDYEWLGVAATHVVNNLFAEADGGAADALGETRQVVRNWMTNKDKSIAVRVRLADGFTDIIIHDFANATTKGDNAVPDFHPYQVFSDGTTMLYEVPTVQAATAAD